MTGSMVVLGWAVLLVSVGCAGVRTEARRRVRARLTVPSLESSPRRRGPAPAAVLLGVAGLAIAWVVTGPTVTIALAGAAGALPTAARLRRRAHERQRRDQQLPAALDQLATALRAGASITQALGEAGAALDAPLGPEVVAIARSAEHGRSLRGVLDEWATVHDDPGTRLAATALVLATVVGSAPAQAVDGVASTLRERLDLAAERRALAVQARTSALVLSVAPVGFAVVLVVGDTAAAGFLLGTPAGWVCLAAGGLLDGVGAWWMTRLSRSDGW